MAISTRLRAPSLAIRLAMWVLTVLSAPRLIPHRPEKGAHAQIVRETRAVPDQPKVRDAFPARRGRRSS